MNSVASTDDSPWVPQERSPHSPYAPKSPGFMLEAKCHMPRTTSLRRKSAAPVLLGDAAASGGLRRSEFQAMLQPNQATVPASSLADQLCQRVVAMEKEIQQMHAHTAALKLENAALRQGLAESRAQSAATSPQAVDCQRGTCFHTRSLESDITPEHHVSGNGKQTKKPLNLESVRVIEDIHESDEEADTDVVTEGFHARSLWNQLSSGHDLGVLGGIGMETLAPGRHRLHTIRKHMMDASKNAGQLATSASRLVALPGTPARIFWDLCGGALICYDLIAIPLFIFDIPHNLFFVAMDWFTMLFWVLNVGNTLTVGFVEDGTMVMSPLKILKNYLRGWFWLDLVTIIPDLIFSPTFFALGPGGASGSVKLLRVVRLIRMVRLLRLLRLRQFIETLNDMLDSEYANIVANILKMLLIFLVINHYIACAWYGVSIASRDDGLLSWAHNWYEEPWTMRYVLSLHWSITQFTPSSKPSIQPANLTERVFVIGIIIFALVGFSYVVGSITGSLTMLRNLSQQRSRELWLMRRFLRQSKVPFTLSLRIRRFVEFASAHQKEQLRVDTVPVLKLLSDQMQGELHLHLHGPHLTIHPLFRHMRDGESVLLQMLCFTAVSHSHLAPGDCAFVPGQSASSMHFLVAGMVVYGQISSETDRSHEEIRPGQAWMSEPALWTSEWVHRGILTATVESDLLNINGSGFEQMASSHPGAADQLGRYARSYLQWLNTLSPNSLSDIMPRDIPISTFEGFIPQERLDRSSRAWFMSASGSSQS